MKRGSQVLLSLVALSLMVVTQSCGLFPDVSNGTKTAYIYIPGATFHSGTAPVTSGANSTHYVTATPSSSTLSTSSSVSWNVTWNTSIEVDTIIVYEESLDGYFEIDLTTDETDAGEMTFDEYVSETKPSTQTCVRDYRGNGTCYEEAPQSTTETDAQVSFIGADSSVGTYVDVSMSLDFVWVEPTDNGNHGQCSGAYSTCNCSVEACCTSSQCGYLVNGGTWYQCAAMSNCSGAAQTVVSACCPTP